MLMETMIKSFNKMQCHKRFIIILVFLLIILLLSLYYIPLIKNSVLIKQQKSSKPISEKKKKIFDPKVILLWSGPETQGLHLACECFVTSDRTGYTSSADAILFNWKNLIDSDNHSIPDVKRPGQTWIWYNREPPSSSFNDLEHDPSWLKSIEHLFDCWISYRNDGDYVHHLFDLVPLTNPLSTSAIAWKSKQRKVSLANKKRNVAWFVTHCNGGRNSFAERLAKYIDLDIYGYDCGTFKCSKINPDLCFQMIEDDYKFILSFETSICNDYVTERLSTILRYNVVPIVFGGLNYSEILPTDSFINAFDFETPSQLIAYLDSVASNLTVYNHFFTWKNSYQVIEKPFNALLCEICESLKMKNENVTLCDHENYTLTDWYFRDSNCYQWDSNMKLIPFKMNYQF